MTGRSCCVCGARRGLTRYRAAEIRGGPAQWVCADRDACAARALTGGTSAERPA